MGQITLSRNKPLKAKQCASCGSWDGKGGDAARLQRLKDTILVNRLHAALLSAFVQIWIECRSCHCSPHLLGGCIRTEVAAVFLWQGEQLQIPARLLPWQLDRHSQSLFQSTRLDMLDSQCSGFHSQDHIGEERLRMVWRLHVLLRPLKHLDGAS